MNFDSSELADEDGPHAARCILGPAGATALRQFRFPGRRRPTGASRRVRVARLQQTGKTENATECSFTRWEPHLSGTAIGQ